MPPRVLSQIQYRIWYWYSMKNFGGAHSGELFWKKTFCSKNILKVCVQCAENAHESQELLEINVLLYQEISHLRYEKCHDTFTYLLQHILHLCTAWQKLFFSSRLQRSSLQRSTRSGKKLKTRTWTFCAKNICPSDRWIHPQKTGDRSRVYYGLVWEKWKYTRTAVYIGCMLLNKICLKRCTINNLGIKC